MSDSMAKWRSSRDQAFVNHWCEGVSHCLVLPVWLDAPMCHRERRDCFSLPALVQLWWHHSRIVRS